MEVALALLAVYANVTKEGKLNLLGLFDRISASNIPWTHPQMQLVLSLEATPVRPHQALGYVTLLNFLQQQKEYSGREVMCHQSYERVHVLDRVPSAN